jgi:WD40 repeat protein
LGRENGSIVLADTATGQRRRVVTGHGPEVPRRDLHLAFGPDGTRVASMSDDRTVVVWNVATGQIQQTLQGHVSPVTGLAFSRNVDMLYSSSEHDGVIAWDLTGTRGIVRKLPRAAGPIAGTAFSPRDPNLLALAQREGPVALWDVTRRTQIGKPLAVTGGLANPVAFSPDGKILAAANKTDGAVTLFDVATQARVGQPLPSLHPIYSPVITAIAFSRDGRLLATAGNEGSVVVWDLTRRVPTGHPLRPGGHSVTAVAFSPGGRTLASGVDSGAVVLTRVPDGTPQYELGGPGTSAVAFSRDGKTLAAATFDGRVRLWDPAPVRRAARRGPRRVERC